MILRLFFVSYTPAIFLGVDGEPVLSEIPKTDLKFVVNTGFRPIATKPADKSTVPFLNNEFNK
jgi:hypothetical protein